MKRVFFIVVSVCTIICAKDMEGHFGIGGNQTLGGVSGLDIRAYVTNDIALDFTLGFLNTNPGAKDADSEFGLGLGFRGLITIARASNVNLLGGAGFSWQYFSALDDNSSNFLFELPLQAEYFFSDHFAINTSVGIVFDILQSGGAKDKDHDLNIGIQNDLFGAAGFSFYF